MNFEEIYQLYFKDVFLYVRSLSAEEGVAEEVTQETFFKALKAIDSYDGHKDIAPGCLRSRAIPIIPDCASKSL